ncbi:putative methyltransferase NSUN7 isoform X2 [Athalia rosae]|nr:putative methyltransferase NSUN7 isoform X2 [Athalia rosae]
MESEADKEPKDVKDWEWQPVGGGYPLRPKGGRKEDSAGSWEMILSSKGSMTEACIQPGWRVGDLILAAQVLQKQKSPAIGYSDEAEMRRVFGLVYDVLRYKNILNHALEDVGFWYRHPEYKDVERIVWLLLYDMQGRKFGRRGEVNEVAARERAFEEAGLKDVEDALMGTRTRLAASVSRLRIGGSALNLGELLPQHLRTAEGVVWGENGGVASGWVNTLKISGKREFVEAMTGLGLTLCSGCSSDELGERTFAFDPMCPKVVNFHDAARETIAKSSLVRNHQFIFLERSLCSGAAALAQAVRTGHLCGPVVLTHAIAPRHTGYLAGLLADIDDAGRLLAFGTGHSRKEYENYLRNLGVTLQQCRVFSEAYTSPPPSAELERATIVLATPPCSYTGVRDAVDLAVARGGDTPLLETLTDVDGAVRQPQVLLAEQLDTLRHALTRPNVQMLVYEVHSVLPAETSEMVEQVTRYANKMAVEKYVREHSPKRRQPAKDAAGSRSARSSKSGKRGQQSSLEVPRAEERRSAYDDEDEASVSPSVEEKVPDSDLFEFGRVDEVCGKSNGETADGGCYLALVRRKEMMQFNSLFMIKVAEAKGLFGDPNKQPAQPREEQQAAPVRQGSQQSRKGCKKNKIQMERIAAPTFSSMVRNYRQNRSCPRHSHRVALEERMTLEQVRDARRRDARRWWDELAPYLLRSLPEIRKPSGFRATRTDPKTRKVFYSLHVEEISYMRATGAVFSA